MPESDDAPPQAEPTLGGMDPGELLARGMQSVKMSGGGGQVWTPPTAEEVAHLFPAYEILSMLGRGGMGAVYKARQTELDRLVAIKLLPLEVSVDKDFADRFRREARAMAKLNHPHIIAVHDFGTTSEGHLFFAMEFVEGANLAQIIHGPGITPGQTLTLAAQVCDALAYAHGKGVVHRDIKPANVMVDAEGRVKVADFGLARVTGADPAQWGATMSGVIMGTPDYMSPEQKRGMNVDHRADIYSLGVMLYEMLCKETPQGIFEPPSQRTGCNPRIDEVVVKAMQQAPERRYQSTGEMKTAVESVANTAPVPPVVIAKKSRAPIYIGIAAAVAALISAAVFFSGGKEKRPNGPPPSAGPEQPAAIPAPVAAAPPAASAEQWVDGLAEWWATSPDVSMGILTKEAGGSRIADTARGVFLAGGRDITVRATVKGPKGNSRGWLTLGLRTKTEGYLVGFNFSGTPVSLAVGPPNGAKRKLQDIVPASGFSLNDSHTFEFTAQGDLLTVLLDGKQVAQVRDSSIKESGRILICGSKGTLIEKLEYRDLGATAAPPAPAAGASSATQDAPWVDALAKWWAKPVEKRSGEMVQEAGGSRVAPGGGPYLALARRNIAARATIVIGEAKRCEIVLRSRNANSYKAIIYRSGRGEVLLGINTKITKLAEFRLPAGFDFAARHTLEFRAHGDALTVLLDGEVVASARDSVRPEGDVTFTGDGVLIEKFETLDLGPDPPAAPAP